MKINVHHSIEQAVGGRPPQYAPGPLLPLWAPKRLAPLSRPRLHSADRNVAVGSHGQYVPTVTAAAV